MPNTAKYDELRNEAATYLDPGETMQAFVYGRTTPSKGDAASMQFGAIGALIGFMIRGRQAKKQAARGPAEGVSLVSPMAVVLTDRRLLVFSIKPALVSGLGTVRGLQSATPIEAVDSITRKLRRSKPTKNMIITAGGVDHLVLTAKAAGVDEMVSAFGSTQSVA